MSNSLERGIRAVFGSRRTPHDAVTVDSLSSSGGLASPSGLAGNAQSAMKLSAVNRCVELLSDSIGKLPIYLIDRQSREDLTDPVMALLTLRPNEAQTPTVFKKMVEANRLLGGNGYAWIIRDPSSLLPKELIPIPHELVKPWRDDQGRVWYTVTHPFTGTPLTINAEDMFHVLGYSHNGYSGISVLQRASEVISAGRAAQQYSMNYYLNGGQPIGVLQTDTDLSGTVDVPMPDGTTKKVNKKDLVRNEWEARHTGPANAYRIAVLDYGLKYSPISISNRDAQFVEQNDLSVHDIARFFGIPLYKLGAGKESYSSNEQNSIEYVVSTLHPIVTQYEEEGDYKILPPALARKAQLRINMMAELRGDFASRGQWYKNMRETGAYSVNDILRLEDLPDVDGGNEHYASLNYVPLSDWKRLSTERNGGDNE